MADSKDDILAHFQSITDIHDMGLAFEYLEHSNWDLMTAISRAMPQDGQAFEPTTSASNSDVAIATLQGFNNFSSSPHSSFSRSGPSTSSNINIIDLTPDMDIDSNNIVDDKLLTFNIHFNQQIYTILMPSSATVGELKEKIENQTKVPICRQAIRGWPPARLREAQSIHSLLRNLDLSVENELILIDLTEDGVMEDENNEIAQRFEETFTLHIVQQPTNKIISLKFPGTQTVLDVKTDVYTITDIPVRYQDWAGWPSGAGNTTTLAQSGIELQHNLVLRSSANDKSKNNAKQARSMPNIDSDSSADEFEDASDFNADDDIFSDSPAQPRLKHLIPDKTDDETVGSIQFVENYVQRYGEPHPVFFQGSLEDALKEACHKPAKDRKLLAIYLHHDESVLTNVFCAQLLRCESVMQTLLHNFILYGWDLTHESNKNLFLSSISACVGVTASITVRNIPVDRLPAIIIIVKNRSTCEVLSVINGNVGVDDLLSRLIEAVELYSEQVHVEIREEGERNAREQVKFEQDMAYQQTLQADMAKEAARKEKEEAIAAERKRLECEKAEKDAKREMERLKAEKSVPSEPLESQIDGITKIRVRKPNGEILERQFLVASKLEDLLNFIISKGFPINEYKIISSWPRRDLTALNTSETLQSLKLFPQETVILEER